MKQTFMVSRTRISLNIMLFLLVISHTGGTLAQTPDGEPMVSLPGGVPPQAPTLLAGAAPATADRSLQQIQRDSLCATSAHNPRGGAGLR
jgi:hypothetical protein